MFGVFPSVVFVFPLFVVFAASHLFLEWPGVVSLTRRAVLPTPGRSDSRGITQFWDVVWTPPMCQRLG